MNVWNEYMSGRRERLYPRMLDVIVEEYEWFTPARRARALVTGKPDDALVLPLSFWPTVAPAAVPVDRVGVVPTDRPSAPVAPPSDPVAPAVVPVAATDSVAASDETGVIDRFLRHGAYRIVPGEDAAEADVEVDIDPEMVSEELAEIYRSQGLVEEAEKIYRMLNLRNS